MTPRCAEVRRARPLLGTFVEITVRGGSEAAVHRAIDEAFETIAEVQRRMSFHDPASMLSELNQRAAREAIRVDEWTYEVLTAAKEMWRISDGVFDITIAPRLQRLGFLPADMYEREPSAATFADVELLREQRVRFRDPGVRLDLGGIAKGFAVDQALATLGQHDVRSALVNAGGDLRALGSFPVTLRNPRDPGRALATVELIDAALASSAHCFADRLVPGATHGPILDPHTGEAAVAVLGASVRARTAMLADALTKVVMLRGEEALPVLEHFSADAVFVASTGGILFTPQWHAALDFSS